MSLICIIIIIIILENCGINPIGPIPMCIININLIDTTPVGMES